MVVRCSPGEIVLYYKYHFKIKRRYVFMSLVQYLYSLLSLWVDSILSDVKNIFNIKYLVRSWVFLMYNVYLHTYIYIYVNSLRLHGIVSMLKHYDIINIIINKYSWWILFICYCLKQFLQSLAPSYNDAWFKLVSFHMDSTAHL